MFKIILKYCIILLPTLSVIWLPVVSFDVGGKDFNLTVSDLVLIVSFGFYLLKKKEKYFFIDNYQMKIFYLPWIIAIPPLIGELIYGSINSVISDIIIFSKRICEYSILLLIIPFYIHLKEVNKIIYSLNLTGVVVFINAIIEYFNKKSRSGSFLIYPNNLGIYSVVIINIFMACAVFSDNKKIKNISFLGIIFGICSLFVSGSRGASIGLLFSSIYYFLIKWPKPNLKLIFLALFIAIVTYGSFLTRIGEVDLFSRWDEFLYQGKNIMQVKSRIEASKIGMKMFLSSPLIGVGVSNVPFYSAKYIKYSKFFLLDESVSNVGNQYLQILVEGGILSLSIIFYWIVNIIMKLNKDKFILSRQRKIYISIAIISNLVALSASGIAMHTFYVPQVMILFWILIGLIYVK